MSRVACDPAPRRWDVFCRVIDNFGDAGVAWRLARQLATGYGCVVRLWIDEPRALVPLAPQALLPRDEASEGGIEVRELASMPADVDPADVVVEAFESGIPSVYLERMAARASPPQWFVLEYLTAETWAESAHGLPSPHPRLGLPRRFWFPGFTPRTGGLLRERDLLARREAFLAEPTQRTDLWRALGLPGPDDSRITVSLFCYPCAPVENLFRAWSTQAQEIRCVVPAGVASAIVARWTGAHAPTPGAPARHGALEVHAVPFVPQDRYDELLWACDVNFVRGEDSFVRAQWAARPFVWHAYPQPGAAHLRKLEAFLGRYTQGLAPAGAAGVCDFVMAWNAAPGAPELGRAWTGFAAHLPALARHARAWAAKVAQTPDLAATLVEAARGKV